MKALIIFYFVFLPIFFIKAQSIQDSLPLTNNITPNPKIIELEKQLQGAKDSKETMTLSYELAEAYAKSDAKKSLEYARKTFDLATSFKNNSLAAQTAFLIADLYGRQRKDNEAINWLKSTVDFAKQAGDADLIINAVVKQGRLATKDRDYRKASQIYEEAFNYFSSKGTTISDLERKYDLQKAQLGREKSDLEAQRDQLENDIKYLISERDQLSTDKTSLVVKQEELVKAKQKVEKEITEKEKALVTVSQEKEKVSAQADEKEAQVKQLSRAALEQQAVVDAARAQVAEAQLSNERNENLRNLAILGAAFLLLVALLTYGRFRANRKAKRVLEQKNKIIEKNVKELMELDQFKNSLIKSIYHDLRFPLTKIKDLSKNALSNKGSIDKSAYFQEISNVSNYLLSISESVLTIERVKRNNLALELAEHNLSSVVDEAIKQIEAVKQKGGVVFFNNIDNDFYAKFHYLSLVRVFVNLISNSLNAVQKKSETQKDFEGKIIINAISQKGVVKISIIDNGIGMTKEALQNLLNERSSISDNSKQEIESTGIGFSFCIKILDFHKTALKIDSEFGEGTTISFNLSSVSGDKKKSENQSKTKLTGFDLNIQEKESINQILSELNDTKLYNFSKIENVIKKVRFEYDSENIKKWEEATLNALYSRNIGSLKELIQIQ